MKASCASWGGVTYGEPMHDIERHNMGIYNYRHIVDYTVDYTVGYTVDYIADYIVDYIGIGSHKGRIGLYSSTLVMMHY